MARLFLHLLLCSVFAVLLFSYAAQSIKPLVKAPEGADTTGHHIVVLKQDSSKNDLHSVIEKVKRLSEDVNVHRYTEHVGKTLTVHAPDHVVEKIRHFDEVSHVEEEDMAYGALTRKVKIGNNITIVNDNLWFLDRLNQPNLPLDNIYTETFHREEEETVDVYVLDSGIEFEHTEFENRAKYAGYDPVDQYYLSNADYKQQNGRDCNGHGTLVASLIGGKTYGTAKKVNLFSVRVLGCDRAAPWSVILDGLNFVANEVSACKRPAIVSMALSGSVHSSINTAISTLYNKNVLVVASAGNLHSSACSYSPSSNSHVLRVGASAVNDSIYEQSNYGSCVDIFAPGEQMEGAESTCTTCTVDGVSGTSLAAALVCGIAAVQLSRSPLIGPADLKQKIIDVSSKNVLDLSSVPSGSPNRLASFDCGGVLVFANSSQELVVQSPNFPRHYPNSLRCTWTIITDKDSLVQVQFEFIKLEKRYDSLKVCNGKSCSTGVALADITGDHAEVSCGYSSSSNSLTLELHTDEITTSTGFKATCISTKTLETIAGCKKPDTTTALQLDVRSEGPNVGNSFFLNKDWEEIFGGRRRGLNLAVIDEVSGEASLIKNFDTYASTSYSLNLAHEIENLHPGALVMMGSSGNAANNLDDRAKHAIKSLGSAYAYSINSGSSWALVGVKGLHSGRAIEQFGSSSAVDVSTQVKLQPHKMFGLRITVMSSGNYNGKAASISIDGKEIEISSEFGSNIGLNVVVFDEDSGEILNKRVFNTHSEAVSDYSPSDAFVDFINALPDGQVVAIAIRGDAITHLTENAKRACESIGSRLIRQAQIDRSWAIIGRKGASPGTVPETVKYRSRAWATYYLPVEDDSNTTFCTISASSSSRWGNCDLTGSVGTYISVNNSVQPSGLCFSYGITIAVVSANECAIERIQTFNTNGHSYQYGQLVNFINGISTGRLVVATIHVSGYNYLYSARAALENIGSLHIRNYNSHYAWAIIGRKGAAPGSVPEAYHQSSPYTASIGAHVPLNAPQLPNVNTCDNTLYPLNCRAGLSV